MNSGTRFVVLLAVATALVLPRETVAQSGAAQQGAAKGSAAKEALLQLERDWEQANAKNDNAALEHILAPEFVSTASDGRFTTRAEIFARRKSGKVKFTAFTQDDYKVSIVGDAAIVTGRSVAKGSRDGKAMIGQERFTDVFVRRDGRWQAIASHSSPIAGS